MTAFVQKVRMPLSLQESLAPLARLVKVATCRRYPCSGSDYPVEAKEGTAMAETKSAPDKGYSQRLIMLYNCSEAQVAHAAVPGKPVMVELKQEV